MNIAFTVLEIVAPVFLLAAIGYLWVRFGAEYRLQFVTNLAMTVSLPCLVFVSLMKTDIAPEALAVVSLATIAAYAGVTLAMAILVLGLRLEVRTYLSPLIFGNTGNLGLPLAFFAFGDEGLGYAVVVFAIMAVWNFTFGVWLVAGRGSLPRAVKEPIVGATLLGALFLVQGWKTPTFLTNTLELIGQMAIPLMLLTLGVAIARPQVGRIWPMVALSAAKALICVSIAAAAGAWFALAPIPFAVLVLQVTTPVAVTSYMLAERYGADGAAVAALAVVSTIMSVLYLPAVLAVLI